MLPGSQAWTGGCWLPAAVPIFSSSSVVSQVFLSSSLPWGLFSKENVGAERLGEKEAPTLPVLLLSKACPFLLPD